MSLIFLPLTRQTHRGKNWLLFTLVEWYLKHVFLHLAVHLYVLHILEEGF